MIKSYMTSLLHDVSLSTGRKRKALLIVATARVYAVSLSANAAPQII
jgi:hypothetical protein